MQITHIALYRYSIEGPIWLLVMIDELIMHIAMCIMHYAQCMPGIITVPRSPSSNWEKEALDQLFPHITVVV